MAEAQTLQSAHACIFICATLQLAVTMGDYVERDFETITDGSEWAERLIKNVLEPAADYFAGEVFAESEIGTIQREASWYYDDDHCVEIHFSARRGNPLLDSEAWCVDYNVCVTQQVVWEEGGYWPPVEEQAEEDELEEYVFAGLDSDIDEDDDDDEPAEPIRFVKEIWDFYMDGEDLLPRKEIRVEYFENGSFVGSLAATDAWTCNEELEEDPGLILSFQLWEESMSRTFSELDIKAILGIIERLGYKFPAQEE